VSKYGKMEMKYKIFYGFAVIALILVGIQEYNKITTWDDFHKPTTCVILGEPDSEGYVWRECITTKKHEADSDYALPKHNKGHSL